MGTSRSYEPPKNGDWPKLKRQLNNFADGDGGDPPAPNPSPNADKPESGNGPSPLDFLAQYIATQGGSSVMAGVRSPSGGASGGAGGRGRGGGGAGGPGRGGGGAARRMGTGASRVGRNLGGFVTRVSQVGLSEALRELDLGHLVGKPAREVARGLVDALAGPGSEMDDVLARIALDKLRAELLAGAVTYEDTERALNTALQQSQVTGLVMKFYGYYLVAMFNRDWHKRLIERVGPERARNCSENIRMTIFSMLRSKMAGIELQRFDWTGKRGHQLAQEILERTLKYFER